MLDFRVGGGIYLSELLRVYGFDELSRTRVKIARHSPREVSITRLYNESRNWFENYQSYQSDSKRFDRCSHVISCLGETPGEARVVGVYKVGKKTEPTNEARLLRPKPWMPLKWQKYPREYAKYELIKLDEFAALYERAVIAWGNERAWAQLFEGGGKAHYERYKILEIARAGEERIDFSDYLDLVLTYSQLRALSRDEAGNRRVINRLTAVAGVYLILDKQGNQYVGSAYGREGIWGRWKAYASVFHGGNKKLKTIKDCDQGDCKFSILQVLPTSYSKDKVIEREQAYKEKLGVRAHGLNCN